MKSKIVLRILVVMLDVLTVLIAIKYSYRPYSEMIASNRLIWNVLVAMPITATTAEAFLTFMGLFVDGNEAMEGSIFSMIRWFLGTMLDMFLLFGSSLCIMALWFADQIGIYG